MAEEPVRDTRVPGWYAPPGEPVRQDGRMSSEGKGRDEYTWNDLCRDLAMETRLTLREAVSVRFGVEPTGAHPYDALPPLVKLFGEGDVETKVQGLKALLERWEAE